MSITLINRTEPRRINIRMGIPETNLVPSQYHITDATNAFRTSHPVSGQGLPALSALTKSATSVSD